MKGCFMCKKSGRLPYVFGQGRMEQIQAVLDMPDRIVDKENLLEYREHLAETEVLFCTWDMLSLTKEQVQELFPRLKVVFYAAASVQYFARPFLECGITVLSAWKIMALPVAQFTVSLITLANKGAFLTLGKYKSSGYGEANRLTQQIFPGSYRTKVGILGAGAIGGKVIEMLADYKLDLLAYDPFLPEERAKEMGVRLCGLDEIFSSCQTISNHLANNKQTVGMLDYRLFSQMSETACFINTGRGAQVVEADLIRALTESPLRSAILDVTDPEPVRTAHRFLHMDNVYLFPHIAGFARDEVLLFSDFMIGQLERYRNGLPFDNCQVTLGMLETMA